MTLLHQVLLGGSEGGVMSIALSVPLIYLVVVASIRVSGKRTTSQMNNFDWIVTVAIGSLMGSGIISAEIGLLHAAVAIVLLLGCQYAVTWSVIRSDRVASAVKATPRLLAYEGHLLTDAMRRERVSEHELLAAVRAHGLERLDQVQAIVLETDATLSVLRQSEGTSAMPALEHVDGFRPDPRA